MEKFLPLDLRAFANAGPATGGQITGFTHGRVRFWGIPFDLTDPASNGGLGWIALGLASGGLPSVTLTLPAPEAAGGLVVAHCTDAEGPDIQIGEVLATYTLQLADGSTLRWPMRRRFELAARVHALGTQGFGTVPQTEPRPLRAPGPHTEGLYGMTTSGAPQNYWLWGAELPAGTAPITAIRLEACSRHLVFVGGLTLARDHAHPLRRSARTAIRIDLPAAPNDAPAEPEAADPYTPAPEWAPVQDDVALSVDLGQIVRLSAATDPTPEAWLAAPMQGWGEVPTAEPVTAIYAEVYATDAADLTVRRGTDEWRVPWRAVLARQAAPDAAPDIGRVRITALPPAATRLKVHVVDEATGQPMSARVHFSGPNGEYLPPHGHTADVDINWGEDIGGDLKLGGTSYAYVPGRFEARLPPGQVFVEAVRGFEYTPLRQVLIVQPGQTELTLPLRRWTDQRWADWYSGDVHVHFLDPTTAALEAAAEDLRVTNVLAVQWGRSFTNVEHGVGTVAASSTPQHLIRVDSENRHHIMGHLFLLGLSEPIHPISSGGPTEDELGGWEDTALADWCDATRAQGGLVCTQFMPTPHAEVVADIILGKIDAVEVRWCEFMKLPGGRWGETPFAFPGVQQWYRYLNCGYRLPAVGGTDKMANDMALGAMRTYAHLPPGSEFTYAAWSDAIRQGHTFSSSGPLIDFQVDGHGLGAELHLPAGGGQVEVTASAQSTQPFEYLEVVQSGQVVARVPAEAGGRSARLHERLLLTSSAWLAARCYGRGKIWTRWPVEVGAHTSPIYVTVNGQRQTSTADASYLMTLMQGGLTYLDTLAAFRDERQRQHHRSIFTAGQAALRQHHPHAHPHDHAHEHGPHTHTHPSGD